MESWRFAHAVVQGSGHAKAGLSCQDAAVCDVIAVPDLGDVLVGIVSDGAGSASRSEIGADLVTKALAAEIARSYAAGKSLRDSSTACLAAWIERVRQEVEALAANEGASVRDFACTLLAAVVEPERAAFLQIGDGAIVVSPRDEPDEYTWVFWPQRGVYANFTRFITDADAAEHIQIDVIDGHVDEVALFSDGLQPLALHYATQTAHAPFFRTLFAPVRGGPPGRCEQLSSSLAAFLGSDRVNERTDDDKSLVLASRRPKAVPLASATASTSPSEPRS